MQSQRKQHQRILRTKAQEHSGPFSEQDPRELEHVTRATIAKKLSKKNLQAKSPLRFTNKYRAVPSSSDVAERRVRSLLDTTTDQPPGRLTATWTIPSYLDRRYDVSLHGI